jgi:hypothetical protein
MMRPIRAARGGASRSQRQRNHTVTTGPTRRAPPHAAPDLSASPLTTAPPCQGTTGHPTRNQVQARSISDRPHPHAALRVLLSRNLLQEFQRFLPKSPSAHSSPHPSPRLVSRSASLSDSSTDSRSVSPSLSPAHSPSVFPSVFPAHSPHPFPSVLFCLRLPRLPRPPSPLRNHSPLFGGAAGSDPAAPVRYRLRAHHRAAMIAMFVQSTAYSSVTTTRASLLMHDVS